jgi:nucleoside-diphosphate-sugar epimerase
LKRKRDCVIHKIRMSKTVLVTGSSGRIGQAVVAELARRGHTVRGFDRVPMPALDDCIIGDLADRSAIERAMRGVECVVHLAATPDDADFLTELMPNNIAGLYHVLEAARDAGVRRLVLASSGQVNWWQQQTGPWPIGPNDSPSPRYWYAATKMFMEAIGRGFAETHGMSVIVGRLGWCPRTREQVAEIAASEWSQDVYFSPADTGRFFACAVEAPDTLRFAIVYAASRPIHKQRFDMTSAKELLGYEPLQQWPEGIEVVQGSAPA